VQEESARSGALSGRSLLVLAVIVAIVGGVAVLTISSGSSRPSEGNIHGVASSRYSGSVATPPESAPPLALRSYTGQRVNIDQYRGKALFVTFLYTKCPDVCPIIASNLGVALNLMGSARASHVQLLAVSVDPRHDTPKAVQAFLARRKLVGRMQYLIGNAHELARVWKAWNVGSEQDTQDPELVNHTGLVYGVSASGKLTTLYAANFQPKEIVHDAPLLASS
jgi:protein SCO1